MATRRGKHKRLLGREAKFVNNEPAKTIPGGNVRKSKSVSLRRYPAIARRRKINEILSSHCFEEGIIEQLRPEDEAILSRMANETITSGTNPILRKNAIRALGHFSTVDSVNTLSELAEYGEDEYVRSCAIESLGVLGIRAAIPLFISGLGDRAEIVVNASAQAIGKIVDSQGEAVIRVASKKEKSARIIRMIDEIIKARTAKPRKKKARARPRRAARD
jgi:HEAT repeat protein